MLDKRLRGSVERGLAPVGTGLHRAGVTADVLTVIGLALSIGTAFVIAAGELRWAVLGIVATGFVDMLDGAVARNGGRAGPRGAFFDSVADRVSDAVLLGGVAWYLAGQSAYLPVLAFAAGALSMLISYERARAEGLGYQARGGLMERAERMVLLGVALFFDLLVPALWLMVALTAITAVHRFVKVWRQARQPAVAAVPEPRVHLFAAGRHRRAPDEEAGSARSLARWWEQRGPGAARERRAAARAARRGRP